MSHCLIHWIIFKSTYSQCTKSQFPSPSILWRLYISNNHVKNSCLNEISDEHTLSDSITTSSTLSNTSLFLIKCADLLYSLIFIFVEYDMKAFNLQFHQKMKIYNILILSFPHNCISSSFPNSCKRDFFLIFLTYIFAFSFF